MQAVVQTFIGADANPMIIVAAYFFIFIPLVSLLLGGISLLRNKNVIGASVSIAMTIVWLFALMTLLITGAKSAPLLQEKISTFNNIRNEQQFEPTLEEDLIELDGLIDGLKSEEQ